jgi:formylglycine-generating enzyme required for sulfatase activity
MLWIPGGSFRMGSNRHYPEEAPEHLRTVNGFWIDKYPVTNNDFRQFVKATDYITLAERVPDASLYPGAAGDKLVPGSVVFKQPSRPVDLRNHHNWWELVAGANWRNPEGPRSSLVGREQHPVVHVAYEDVEAYARWTGKEIPNEAEWEFAARGGIDGAVYAWGNEMMPNGRMMANFWQGEFPLVNLGLDGFERTSPVGSFPPNGYGLCDMIGNVWEWTTDWFLPRHAVPKTCCSGSVKNDAREASYDPRQPGITIPRKVLKGGSFLCAANYCLRYRPAARIGQQIDTGTCHQGFRCVFRRKQN